MKILLNNITFVKKAVKTPGTGGSRLGMERPSHKYIKRENLGNGQYKYIYEDAKGKSAPSQKDTEALVADFSSSIAQDKLFKKYAPYFDASDYTNVAGAIIARGEDATSQAFLKEMQYANKLLGHKASRFLPTVVAAKEYRKLFSLAGKRTSEYNDKISTVKSELISPSRGE
jgi:hypothetical protein